MEDFGAKGDGRTDDTAALQRALRGVAVGGTLALTRGRTYLHSDVLTLTVANVVLTGGGRFLATREERSALRIEADGVTLDGVTLGVRATTRRWDAPDQHRLYIAPCRGLVVRRVTVTGSAASGVFLAGAADFRLEDVTVKDTRADGIHLSQGSRSGQVLRPRLSGTGDDGVAVVSYLQDGAPCRDIRVDNPVVRGTRGGRVNGGVKGAGAQGARAVSASGGQWLGRCRPVTRSSHDGTFQLAISSRVISVVAPSSGRSASARTSAGWPASSVSFSASMSDS